MTVLGVCWTRAASCVRDTQCAVAGWAVGGRRAGPAHPQEVIGANGSLLHVGARVRAHRANAAFVSPSQPAAQMVQGPSGRGGPGGEGLFRWGVHGPPLSRAPFPMEEAE